MEEFTFDRAIYEIMGLIDQGRRFIGIGGGTASGKSYLSLKLAKNVGAKIVEMDNYYRGKTYIDAKLNGNYDHPDAIDLKLFEEHIMNLKAGKQIQMPIYDMKTSERHGYHPIEPAGVFVMNGLFVLADQLAPNFDVRIYLKTSKETTKRRRYERNVAEGRLPIGESIDKYFDTIAWPMHMQYVEPTMKNADIVVNNDQF